jgi:hypothetical protein
MPANAEGASAAEIRPAASATSRHRFDANGPEPVLVRGLQDTPLAFSRRSDDQIG